MTDFMAQRAYRKLTSRRRNLLGYSQLWMGEGHLLLLKSARLVETYQRFALKDIQAIVISDGPNLLALQILGVVVSLAWAALALEMSSRFGQGFFVITGFLGLLLAIIDIARGPRCRCVLHTAVSKELLSPVSRRNASWKFMSQVAPAIEAIQGAVNPDELQIAASQSIGPAVSQPPEVKRGRSYVAEIFFGLMMIDAVLIWVALRTSVPNAYGLMPTIYLAEIILAAVTLSQKSVTRAALLAWSTLGLLCVLADISTNSGIAAWSVFLNSQPAFRDAEPRVLDSIWLSARTTALVATGGRLGLGVIGLALCYFDRRNQPA